MVLHAAPTSADGRYLFSTPVGDWDSFRDQVSPLFDMIGAQVEPNLPRVTFVLRFGTVEVNAQSQPTMLRTPAKTCAQLEGLPAHKRPCN